MPNQAPYLEDAKVLRNVGGDLAILESFIQFSLLRNTYRKLSLNGSWDIAAPQKETFVLIREEFSIGKNTQSLSIEEIVERLNESRNDVLLMPYEDFNRDYFKGDNNISFSSNAISLWLFFGFYDRGKNEFTPFVRLVANTVQPFECHFKWRLF